MNEDASNYGSAHRHRLITLLLLAGLISNLIFVAIMPPASPITFLWLALNIIVIILGAGFSLRLWKRRFLKK